MQNAEKFSFGRTWLRERLRVLLQPAKAAESEKQRRRDRQDAALDARCAALRARFVEKFGDLHPAVVALDEAEARARAANV